MCITVSAEKNFCKLTSQEDSESWSSNTPLVPLVVSGPVTEGEEKEMDKDAGNMTGSTPLVPSVILGPMPVEGRERVNKEVGKLTGNTIFGKSNLVMREKRWRKKISRVETVKQTKKDMTAYTLSRALQLQHHGEIVFTRATDGYDILRPIVPKNFSAACKFEEGWALRKGPGHMYGDKYTRNFRMDIEEQYQLGEKSSSAKSSPAKILEYLEKKYAEELCLPSESDIRAEISRLIAAKKKLEAANKASKTPKRPKKKQDASNPVNNRQMNASTPDSEAQGTQPQRTGKEYLKFVIELAALETPISPKEAVRRVLEKFPRNEYTLPSDKQLSNSFTYQKRKIPNSKKVIFIDSVLRNFVLVFITFFFR